MRWLKLKILWKNLVRIIQPKVKKIWPFRYLFDKYFSCAPLWLPFCLKLWFLPLTRLARLVPSLGKASFQLVARKAIQKRRHFFWSHPSKWLFFCLFCFPSSSKHHYRNVQFKTWLYAHRSNCLSYQLLYFPEGFSPDLG